MVQQAQKRRQKIRGKKIIFKGSILIFILLGCSQSVDMETALMTIANTGTSVTLEQITDFQWDKVYVIGPYDTFDHSHIRHIPHGNRQCGEVDGYRSFDFLRNEQ